jgi:Fe-Mn family superoxide dismutase
MAFELPPLSYAFDALEPEIDARTVEIHYTKHHATYLKNLNAALEKAPQLFEKSLADILSDLSSVPEEIRTAVRNNGGGVYNHNLYWQNLTPEKGGKPVGNLAAQIDRTFGSFDNFKAEFEKAGLGRFGSGYAWLSLNAPGKLLIHSTANQDCPLSEGNHPLFVVDVWEHAYYLHYQNRRAEYLTNIWNVINWIEAEKRFNDYRK